MKKALKFDGFLPKIDGRSLFTLYRLNLSPEGGKRDKLCIALLIDTSGSMAYQMGHLKEAILSTVEIILGRGIASIDEIVLVQFHSYARIISGFKDIEHFRNEVSKLYDAGGTNYAAAIDLLRELLVHRKTVIAVMFSDGEPWEYLYLQSIENLKVVARNESLLFHSIGLNVNERAEQILRYFTTIGATEGHYQSIDGAEIVAAMNVLVDHFNCQEEMFIGGTRTRNGFIVDTDSEYLMAESKDRVFHLEVVTETFQDMLEKNSFKSILEAFHFVLEYHLRDESLIFDIAVSIATHISSLLKDTENRIRMFQKEKTIELSNEKKAKLKAIVEKAGARSLKQQSKVLAEYNQKIQKALKEQNEILKKVHELKELCSQIQETLHQNRNISASVSGNIMETVNKFRDNSIAQSRKHIARFSSKVREGNEKFRNIDQSLQEELDYLVKQDSIPVPKYFENYSDPITLDEFQDIMLQKFGVFMLLISVERHEYGITAPHKTKVTQIGGFSSSVLDVMMNNKDKSILFDFRGIGTGNAAIPLWISYLHWKKARHVFGPLVGHAVTGNELEYTKLQGMTLLALILVHLRRLEATEFNKELIRMVGETLKVVLDKQKWEDVAKEVSNSFDSLNENKIPSIEVFMVFQEFIDTKLPRKKALLVLAEQYRRKNVKRIENGFEKLKSSYNNKCNMLIRLFPKIYKQYLNVSATNIWNPTSMDNYFLNLYDGDDSKLVKWFDLFSESLGPSLKSLASSLNRKQKVALVLSVHKCTCYKWEAIDEIPAGLSYDSEYTNILHNWCQKLATEKRAKLRDRGNEATVLRILQTDDRGVAETVLKDVKRNSPMWAVLKKVLLPSIKVGRPSKLTVEKWEEYRAELFQKQIESMAIPLHFQLLMYCVFGSFEAQDWISSKMVWRPNLTMRRRIKAMFPQAPLIE